MEKNSSSDHFNQAMQDRVELLLAQVPAVVWESWEVQRPELGMTNYISSQVESLLGYTPEEWLAMPRFGLQVVHPDDREKALAETYEILESRKGGTYGFRCISKFGKVLHLEARVVVVCDDQGNPLGMRGVTVDVTERRKFETERSELLSQLQAALEMKDEFFSVASHELRTPITSLMLQAQLLLRFSKKNDFPPGIRQKLEALNSHARRLDVMIDNLLDVTRIRNGKFNIDPEMLDLSELVTESVARFSDELEMKGIAIQLDVQPSVIGRWDGLRLEQVVTNLLSNAIRYGLGNPIVLTLRSDQQSVILEVQDQGKGISPDQQTAIFGLFNQGDVANRKAGLGLGLFVVKQIIEAHLGTVQVVSAPGEGSRFIVTLPR